MPVSMVGTEPMVPTLLPTDMDTEPMVPTLTLTMERGLLMLSPRLRLMLRLTPLSSTVPMDIHMPVSMVDTEPMVPTPPPMDMDTEPMEPTLTPTMERGLLMLSPRLRLRLMLRLTLLSSTDPTDIPMPVSMVDTPLPIPDMATEPMEPTPTLTMERGLLMPSLRLMLRLTPLSSTAPTDIPTPLSMVDTLPPTDMDTEPMEPTPILTMERGL